MLMRYLLDTNICIYLIKQHYPSVQQCFEKHPIEKIFLSSITVYELFYGAEKSQYREKNKRNLKLFCEQFTIINFDEEAAYITANIRSQLEKKGQVIGSYDLQIAGIALAHQLTLVSNNLKEFERIPELLLENWLVLPSP
ncbi:PIN domain-containing protein [Beggiatoa leptomitoformis]|uniref:PIN domain-containing protein n=2 Tax=Beggiatoa leptomitoformis TaxID=288004 RepID=A0A2N9YCS2_9GAMM|nr:PIN domain-containing protein [Beggiatoa leptomitoformis]AUI68224.1 PIN domain-containing protein [Beggiatoa leptomitoformis]